MELTVSIINVTLMWHILKGSMIQIFKHLILLDLTVLTKSGAEHKLRRCSKMFIYFTPSITITSRARNIIYRR
ncbi:hypothetical protein L798_01164 [Zootermopsis nevadensis]|uniref:Uncharacterized protein n=1 Tax=Zootermopsis nevadensis TaxID=136037 RepID=A0A067RRB2_ZOONE|nr:hypothetical protein L798_01164 [Zootermopsis nevadensis]